MIRVLVVDDSTVVRRAISRALSSRPGVSVVAEAKDAFEARELIKTASPDVITLDIDMPGMDGLTFLGILMNYNPMPVVVVSSMSAKNREMALEALRLGAFEVVDKDPRDEAAARVMEKVVSCVEAAHANRWRYGARKGAGEAHGVFMPPLSPSKGGRFSRDARSLIAIGASTGGTLALEYILPALPASLPPIVIVQHMPTEFTPVFAKRLDALCKLSVKEAEDGESLLPGFAYVAPGGLHLEVEKNKTEYSARLSGGDKVEFQRPSADVLFFSVAAACGSESLCLLMTGMGRDGANGLLAVRRSGGRTLIQSEATSLVWGMPGAAWELGAADETLDLGDIPARLAACARGP